VIITVAGHKEGVGKTTTAFHLAAILQEQAPTLLLDGDETRNATAWSRRGGGVAFRWLMKSRLPDWLRSSPT
jgi:chromosome partitioning protein